MRALKTFLYIKYLWLALPVAVTALSSWLIAAEYWEPSKWLWDVAGLSCTIVTASLAIWRVTRESDVFYKWLAVLMFTLMLREIHFAGTSALVYLVALGLLVYAILKFNEFQEYLYNENVITPFSCAILCYVIAVGMDGHWWKFIPGGKPVWTLVEEIIEVTGHLFMMYVVVTARQRIAAAA